MDGIHFDATAKELITKASGAVKLQSAAFSGAGVDLISHVYSISIF